MLLVLPAFDGIIFREDGLGVLPTVEANLLETGATFYLLKGLRTVLPFLATGFLATLRRALVKFAYRIAFLKSKLGQLELSKGIFGSVIEEISPKSISEINLLIPKEKKILNKIVKEIKESEKSRNLSMQSNVNAMNEIENFFSN